MPEGNTKSLHLKYVKVGKRQLSELKTHQQSNAPGTMRCSTEVKLKKITWDVPPSKSAMNKQGSKILNQNMSTLHKQHVKRRSSIKVQASFHENVVDDEALERCPWLESFRPDVQRVLRIVELFESQEFNQRQVAGWVRSHCLSYKPILIEPFFHKKELRATRPKTIIFEMEKKESVVMKKLNQAWKESSQGTARHIKVKEITWFAEYMEVLFLERSRINARDACDSIAGKMSDCFRVSHEEQAHPVPNLRNKPVELKNFLSELKEGEDKFGSMKLLTGFQKARFDMLNEVDKMMSNRLAAAALQMPRKVPPAIST